MPFSTGGEGWRGQGELSEPELEIYSRQIALEDIGYEGQLKLRNARVCLMGVGGLGSLIALQLVAMGVGFLRIVDRDIVSRSDLHRQYLYDVDLLGLSKVEGAFRKLSRLNPDVSIEPVPQPLLKRTADGLVSGMDVVVDGLDRPSSRYVLNRACHRLGVPYVFGGAIGNSGNVSTILPSETACIECFMPGLGDEDVPRCANVGVHPSLLGVVASVEVSEAVGLITGKGPQLLNKLLHVDLARLRFVKVNLSRNPECGACGADSNSPRMTAGPYFEETCGRDGGRNFILTPKQHLEIDLDALSDGVRRAGFVLKAHGLFGLTFEIPELTTLSILRSGVVISKLVPGQRTVEAVEVLELLRPILVEKLGLAEAATALF